MKYKERKSAQQSQDGSDWSVEKTHTRLEGTTRRVSTPRLLFPTWAIPSGVLQKLRKQSGKTLSVGSEVSQSPDLPSEAEWTHWS